MRKKVKIEFGKILPRTKPSRSQETETLSEPASGDEEKPAKLVAVKCGRPEFDVTFRTIKLLTAMSLSLIILCILFSLKLFASSIGIRKHLGQYINMVSEGDGSKLPVLQAIPVLCFFLVDVAFVFFIFKIFDRKKQNKFNWFLYILLMMSVALICITFILLIVVLSHVYSENEGLHNGIVEAMNNYSGNSLYKKRIDRLQIEFQCCGSKKYDEWYNIKWYDTSLVKKAATDNTQGNTPFSCCSISSIFPCIHHNIETTGKAYLYTPEQNLSISTKGCYDGLRKKTKEVGWGIVGNLVLFIILQVALVICLRFLQTAHYAKNRFEGHSRLYTVWLFGCASAGKNLTVVPPEPPPVPEELMS
nr:photoreceptor outer segment membrane glycoprotein 2-like [Leptinotarsa decemlineata]